MNEQGISPVRYVARRLLQALPLCVGVVMITFVLIHLAPGDPLYALAGEGGDEGYYREMRARYGLDKPLPEQLLRYLGAVAQGDFGLSLRFQQPVFEVIRSRLPATLLLMGTALAFSTTLGLLLGVLAATRPGSFLDGLIAIGSLAVYAMPVFWLGQLLIIVFAVQLRLLPVQGMFTARGGYSGLGYGLDLLRHLVLPATTLGLLQLATLVRLTRTSLRAALGEDFVRTARAKGLRERAVVWRHALRNASLPIVTAVGGQVSVLLTGAALTETIFAWPGLGRLLLDATLNRDYPLLMAIFILASLSVIVVNLLTDLLYMVLDPRVRYS